jgi:hypothetical protein
MEYAVATGNPTTTTTITTTAAYPPTTPAEKSWQNHFQSAMFGDIMAVLSITNTIKYSSGIMARVS